MAGTWVTIYAPVGGLSIDFNHTDDGLLVPDENGVFWTIEEFDGWDGADVRQVTLDEYGNDGIAVGVNEFASRLVTLKNGFAFAPSESARWGAQNQFGQLLAATVAQGPCFMVVHQDIDRFMYGYLASKPEYKDVPRGTVAGYFPTQQYPFQFEGSLLCPFPIKQSVAESSPMELTRDGSVAIPTAGNYPVLPKFTFAFPANGDMIFDQVGNVIVVTSAIRGSNADMPNELIIDCQARTVKDGNGNLAWDCIQSIGWPQLEPNSATLISYTLGSSSPLGTQEGYVTWNDAWL